MSASKKRKERQANLPEQEVNERELRRQEEEKSDRRSMMLYAITGILVVVLGIFAVVMNSGLIQRGSTAVTINGTKYTPAEVQYYFNSALSGTFGIAPGSMDLKDTVMDEATGETAYDYVLDIALENMTTTTALYDKAVAEGVTLSQAARDSLDAYMKNLDSSWITTGYPDRDTFIRSNFGPYMTFDRLGAIMEREALASEYANAQITALEYTDADYEAYYEENKDALDTYTYTQFFFQAKVDTTDAEGNTIEMTDEEKAAKLAEAEKEMEAAAKELQSKLTAGADPAKLAEEYADQLFSSDISTTRVGSSLNSSYAEWMQAAARKEGNITLADYSTSTVHNYYVVRFEGRDRDETTTDDVRHILLEDETTAATLLDLFKAGEATEESFASLAAVNSIDTGSAANGGLISGITPTSNYVENFLNWAVDSSRKEGDTGLVSSDYGWHIMYYVGEGDPVWARTADTALRNTAYTEMLEVACEGYEAVQGSGMKYVEG